MEEDSKKHKILLKKIRNTKSIDRKIAIQDKITNYYKNRFKTFCKNKKMISIDYCHGLMESALSSSKDVDEYIQDKRIMNLEKDVERLKKVISENVE